MRAVMLAGGMGTRLWPYTVIFPKALMPLGDMPIVEVMARQLRHYGVDHVTMAVGHLAELMMSFLGDGSRFGLRIDYSREDEPLGTAAPLRLIDGLPETFLVMNADLLTTLDYRDLLEQHRASGADLTVATRRREAKVDFGVIETDGDGHIVAWHEKPSLPYTVSMGVYAVNRVALDYIPPQKRLDFPDLIRAMMGERRVATYRFEDRWLDIGRHDDFEEAQRLFAEHRDEFLPGG